MNFLYLRAYYAVATERSFTRAAQVLNVSQSTLSSQVKALEEAYGVHLLDRRGRSVYPTEMGQALLVHCRDLLRQEEAIDELLSQNRRLRAGQLKIGADGPKHVVPILKNFLDLHPNYKVALFSTYSRKVAQDLLDYETDVAVVALDGAPHEQLHVEPLMRYALVAFVPKAHPLAKKRVMELSDFAQVRLIIREPVSKVRQLLMKRLERAGVTLQKNLIEMNSREAALEAVAAGMGVSVMGEVEFPKEDKRTVALKINDPELAFTEVVACRKNRKDSPAIKEFFKLAESFRQL
jgi:DNA-binding transcriptional LysR family regulator